MTSACDHLACLRHVEIERTGEIIIEDTGRFWRIIDELPNPTAQTPQITLFIGTNAKDVALKHIFTQNNIRRRGERGNINLRLDTASIAHDAPLLFLDSSPFIKNPTERSHVLCHETISYTASWRPDQHAVIDILHARLLFLFSNVICVFADDFNSIEAILLRMMTWSEIGAAVHVAPELRPRLLIVVSEDSSFAGPQCEELQNGLHSCSGQLKNTFSVVKTFHLAGSYLSPMARHQRLQLEIRSQNQQMFDIKQQNHMLLSAFHLASLFAAGIEWTASTSKPFHFITASRIHNGIGSDYLNHLQTFLQLARDHKTEYNSVASLIASSIIMDAYPPRMHRFPVKNVFELLYRDPCYKALSLTYNNMFAHHLCGEIERHCIQQFELLDGGFISSSRLHWGNIRKLDRSIPLYKSNTTCLFCLRRLPEYHLSCGHCACKQCVLIFGVMLAGREDRFKVHCIYDDWGRLTVDLKPDTAGIKAIGIDGGGARGATSLEFLKELQKALLSCPLHEMVDIVAGSSSGGLIALAQFHLQWSVEQSIKTFDSFAIRCFQRSKSVFGILKSAVKYAMTDAIYDETTIESLMKDTYGSSTVFFGERSNMVPGTRVAVTAMTHGSQRAIFTNYNGSSDILKGDTGCHLAPRFQDDGYIVIRPSHPSKEPLLWEVARATSAAPLIFKPVQMSAGEFWDGALGFPNPTELATWEASRVWPGTVLDVAISFGTGEEPKNARSTNSRSRLLDSFNLFLDGQLEFLNIKHRSTPNQELLRLNSRLPHSIRLDDAEGIPFQKHCVHVYSPARQNILEAATALLVSNFYFQLDCPTKYNSGVYYCEGSVRCRGDHYQVLDALAKLHSSHIEFFTKSEVLSRCQLGEDVCAICHRYRKDVSFTVRHPTDLITISMRLANGTARKISGFPQTLAWFEGQQGFDNHFGTPNHDSPGEIRCLACARKSSPGKHRITHSFSRSAKRVRR